MLSLIPVNIREHNGFIVRRRDHLTDRGEMEENLNL
jgi:hypothetical protein